jgi:hypothetical protein
MASLFLSSVVQGYKQRQDEASSMKMEEVDSAFKQ